MSDWNNRVEPDRCLAQIVTIDKITSIPKAEAIELAAVLGWQCVIKKNEFKIGDKVIYVSIDAIMDPDDPLFAFLDGKRVKTRNILKTLSQGLIFNLDIIVKKNPDFDLNTLNVGDDVTKLLGIYKYLDTSELTVYKPSKNSKAFPDYVPKTDEERLQNIVNILDRLIDRDIIITRKEDGTSATYIFKDGEFLMASRNFVVDNSPSPYSDMAKLLNIESSMRKLGRNIAIQGEIVGPKINGNRLRLNNFDYRVFNIYDIDNKAYLKWSEVKSITNDCNLNTVPILYEGKYDKIMTFDHLMKMADSLEYYKGSIAEGIVVKTEDNKISFKVISNKYLQKN